jgi:hypothetical protein
MTVLASSMRLSGFIKAHPRPPKVTHEGERLQVSIARRIDSHSRVLG